MKKLLLLCLALYCSLMLLNSLNAIPIADDFCNVIEAHRLGGLTYAAQLYMKWTGRFLTSLILGVTSEIVPLEYFNFVSALLVGLFFVFLHKNSKLISKDSFVVFAIFAAVTWFTYRTVLGRIVIWYTGGLVYILCYALIPFFFHEFIKCLEKKKFSPWLIFLSLLLANSIETIPPALIFFTWAYAYLSLGFTKESAKFGFKIALLITLCSVPLFLAPGNFARAQTMPAQTMSLISLLKSYGNVASTFFDSASNMIYMLIPFGLLAALMLDSEERLERRKIGISLMVSGIASALPMGFAQGFNGSRPASLFVFLFSFGIFAVFSSLNLKRNFSSRKELTASILLFITSSFIVFDFTRGIPFRKHFTESDTYLKTMKGQEVTVEPFKGKTPRSLNGHEISEDKTDWKNVCVAHHYGLKSIELSKAQSQ